MKCSIDFVSRSQLGKNQEYAEGFHTTTGTIHQLPFPPQSFSKIKRSRQNNKQKGKQGSMVEIEYLY